MGRVRERAHSPAIREFVIKTSGSGIQTVASDSVADPIFWNTDRLKLYKKIIAIFSQQVLNLKLSLFFERNTSLFFTTNWCWVGPGPDPLHWPQGYAGLKGLFPHECRVNGGRLACVSPPYCRHIFQDLALPIPHHPPSSPPSPHLFTTIASEINYCPHSTACYFHTIYIYI